MRNTLAVIAIVQVHFGQIAAGTQRKARARPRRAIGPQKAIEDGVPHIGSNFAALSSFALRAKSASM